MSEDEKFDQWLSREAHDYNRPSSEIPRDAMWAAIERSMPSISSRFGFDILPANWPSTRLATARDISKALLPASVNRTE